MSIYPLSLVVLLAPAFAPHAQASELESVCHSEPGFTECHEGKLPSLSAYGQVILDGTTVTGKTVVHGQLQAESAHLNTLTVHGNTVLSSTDVRGKAKVYGHLEARDSECSGVLWVAGQRLDLLHSKTGNIVIKNTPKRVSRVILTDGSLVQGHVNFLKKGGEVWVSPDSKLIGGVKHGQIKSGEYDE